MSDNQKPASNGNETRQKSDWAGADRKKQPSPSGTIVFTFLRLLDVPLQYHLLSSGLGARMIKTLGGSVSLTSVLSPVIPLGLSPYHTLIVGLAAGSAAKHIFWKLYIADYFFPPSIASIVSSYNTALNTANTLLALWALSTNAPSGSSWSEVLNPLTSTVPLGLALYVTGIVVETVAEIQRKAFKQQPGNKDKPFSGGLFGLARNINYGGYLLWRIGYATVCAGLPWGAVIAAWQAADFAFRAVPSMDAYCEKRYGDQWKEVRQRVPYRLLPGIW